MSKSMYETVIINTVLSHSESQDYNKAKLEWSFTGIVNDYGPLKDQKPQKKCQLCGHPIRYGYILQNRKNNKKVEVGSECVENYLNITPQLEGKLESAKQSIIKKAEKVKKEAKKEYTLKLRIAAGWASIEVQNVEKAVNKTYNYKDREIINKASNNNASMYKYIKSGVVADMAKKYGVKLNMDRITRFMSIYKPE